MDIMIFIVFIGLALLLSFFAWWFRGNLGLALAFLGGGIFLIIGIAVGNGEAITTTVYFDESTFVTHDYSLGISASNIMILLGLIGVLDIMTAVADWIGF